MAPEGEHTAPLGAHIEAVENLAHAHGQEGHGHAVGGDAPGHFKASRLHAVADDVGGHGDDGDKDALIGDVEAQAAGEDAVLGGAGRAAHDVRLRALHAQGQGREAVGDEVDEQQVDGVEEGEAQQGGEEHPQHLAHVAGQQEADGLADVVVNPAALGHGAHDGGKVVVGEDHVRHVFGDVGAGDAHADADIGGLDGGGVVDAVAGHGGDGSPAAPGADDADLVLRLDPGIDAVAVHVLSKLLIAEGIQRRAGDGLGGVGENAQLAGDGHGGVLVVAGDHHRADARLAALLNGGLHLGPHRVDHAGKADEAEFLL